MRHAPTALLLTTALLALPGCNRLKEVPAALPAASAPQDTSATAKLREEGDGLLALHRQIVVLMDGEGCVAGQRSAARLQALGQQLFHELLERQQRLADLALKPDALEATAALLTRIEAEQGWFDADRLAFKEVLGQLATGLKNAQTLDGIKLARRAQEDLDTLAEVEKAYEQELKEAFGGLPNAVSSSSVSAGRTTSPSCRRCTRALRC